MTELQEQLDEANKKFAAIRHVLANWTPSGFGAANFYGEAACEALHEIEAILDGEEVEE